MARVIFTSIVGIPDSDRVQQEMAALQARDGVSNVKHVPDDDNMDEPEGAMTPAQLSDALALLGLETKYVFWEHRMPSSV